MTRTCVYTESMLPVEILCIVVVYHVWYFSIFGVYVQILILTWHFYSKEGLVSVTVKFFQGDFFFFLMDFRKDDKECTDWKNPCQKGATSFCREKLWANNQIAKEYQFLVNHCSYLDLLMTHISCYFIHVWSRSIGCMALIWRNIQFVPSTIYFYYRTILPFHTCWNKIVLISHCAQYQY